MLDALDKINWAAVRHCYGPALDTPTHLEALLSDDATTREAAMGGLWDTLTHQGTVYEATLYAIPFLLKLLRAQTVQGKAEILDLLVCVTHGNFPDHYVVEEKRLLSEIDTPEARQEVAQRRGWVHQIQVAVSEGRDTYLLLLADPDIAVRQSALGALVASCIQEATAVAPALRRQLVAEPDRILRASFVRCLGRFQPLAQETIALLNRVHSTDADALLRLTAAAALADGLGERAPEGIEEALASSLAASIAQPETSDESAYHLLVDDEGWPHIDYIADLCSALRTIGARGIDAALPRLRRDFAEACADSKRSAQPHAKRIKALRRLEAPDGASQLRTIEGQFIHPPTPALKLAEILLTLTFGLRRDQPTAPAILSDQQRRTLTLLLACDAIWRYGINMDGLLTNRGLPPTRMGLRRYQEQTPVE